MILATLSERSDQILARLSSAPLQDYNFLQRHLNSKNVFEDRDYRRTFNRFYRMRQRTSEWYDYFFKTLEEEKNSTDLTFGHILFQTYEQTGRVEASFSSKLVATIRPEMPVYDKYVAENLNLSIPKQYEKPHVRLMKYVQAHDVLRAKLNDLIAQTEFLDLRARFDRQFPQYSHFTDTKKLDLFLWQAR